ncbi:MAG TPA: hypothetical protein VFT60_04325 [Bryobacteraceae bacterium]|nr:hypothetical protein [Bryobacteraceae bacterium]
MRCQRRCGLGRKRVKIQYAILQYVVENPIESRLQPFAPSAERHHRDTNLKLKESYRGYPGGLILLPVHPTNDSLIRLNLHQR